MSKAESGDLTAEAEPLAADEIGTVTLQYNRMLARIRPMNQQLASEHRLLEDRVREATAEIVERKQQLEDANLQLFELQRQLSRLERLAVAGQMAAEFAHEVGTPLNLISGHVQLLRARVTEPRTITRLDVIAEQINRITNIVRRMLDSTRRPRPQLEKVDINSLLARVLDASQPTLAVRNVRLETRLDRELPQIEADPDQLQQVFLNLINNSLDAMPEGGLIRVSTALDQDSVIIELSDTGMGIPQDQLELVFDPLFTAKPGSGTGLGLTIVKQIVTEHAGQIKVQSEPGRGTTFAIRLPLSKAEGRVAASITEGTPLEKKV
jgi:signal transduction histidine kinase